VSAATREKVERAMSELGFVRNESARALRAGQSRVLAYVMLDAGNPFFTDVAMGVELAAEEADLSLFICNSANRTEREETHLAHLQQQRVQGILITPVDPAADHLDAIARRGTPLVVVDRIRQDESFCSVAVDDVLGGRLAVEHLVDRGHTRVAIVGYDDIEFASAAAVPLTSVRQPRQQLGQMAAELVLDEASNPAHAHQQVTFTPELVARASTLG
jgi:LacI family transcriptional regulator